MKNETERQHTDIDTATSTDTSKRAKSLLDQVIAKTIQRGQPTQSQDARSRSNGHRVENQTYVTQAVTSASTRSETMMGECIATEHPALVGRVRVAWTDAEQCNRSAWLPCLHGITCRVRDRVLLAHPANFEEPIVLGVVDGFTRRPTAEPLSGPSLTLARDEALTIQSPDGKRLFCVSQDQDGAVIRLLDENCNLEVAGRLRIAAKQLELAAVEGRVDINANEDVVVRGERIDLN